MQYTVGVGTSSRCDGGGACSCASGCDASVSSSVVTIGGAWGDPNGVGVGLAWKTLSPSLSYRLKPLFCPSNSASNSGKGEFPASGEQEKASVQCRLRIMTLSLSLTPFCDAYR